MVEYIDRNKKMNDGAEVEMCIQWYSGASALACLDWNEYYYELWFEDNDNRREGEFTDLDHLYEEMEEEQKEIDVIVCYDLEEVNKHVMEWTKSKEYFFYEDETFGGITCC